MRADLSSASCGALNSKRVPANIGRRTRTRCRFGPPPPHALRPRQRTCHDRQGGVRGRHGTRCVASARQQLASCAPAHHGRRSSRHSGTDRRRHQLVPKRLGPCQLWYLAEPLVVRPQRDFHCPAHQPRPVASLQIRCFDLQIRLPKPGLGLRKSVHQLVDSLCRMVVCQQLGYDGLQWPLSSRRDLRHALGYYQHEDTIDRCRF